MDEAQRLQIKAQNEERIVQKKQDAVIMDKIIRLLEDTDRSRQTIILESVAAFYGCDFGQYRRD